MMFKHYSLSFCISYANIFCWDPSIPSKISSYDALHGVAGVYAKRIFVEELGAEESSLLNCTPKVRWWL